MVEILGHLLFARLAAARCDDVVVAVHIERARQILPGAKEAVIDHIDRVELRVMLDRGDTEGAKELWSRLAPSTLTDMLGARLLLASTDDAGARQVLLSITDLQLDVCE